MKRTIVQYDIVATPYADLLARKVNEFIVDGWELHGDLLIRREDKMLIQAVVKCCYT